MESDTFTDTQHSELDQTQGARHGEDPTNAADPMGLATEGTCVGGGFDLGGGIVEVSATACVEKTVKNGNNPSEIGWTGAVGALKGLGSGADGEFFYQFSNATSLGELSGAFNVVKVVASDGLGITGELFWNNDDSVYGIDVGIAVGVAAEVEYGITDTDVHVSTWDPAKWLEEAFLNETVALNPATELALAAAAINKWLTDHVTTGERPTLVSATQAPSSDGTGGAGAGASGC